MEITEQIDRLAREATARGGLHLGKAAVLRSSRHCLRAGTKRLSQGHHTIDRQAKRRGAWEEEAVGDLASKDEKWPPSGQPDERWNCFKENAGDNR